MGKEESLLTGKADDGSSVFSCISRNDLQIGCMKLKNQARINIWNGIGIYMLQKVYIKKNRR